MTVGLNNRERLGALDGWRVVAVVLVVISHLFKVSALHETIPPALSFIGEFGLFGVQIFFVISGYVICSVLIKEFNKNERISLTAFYLRRCFRILPPLWCYLAVLAIFNQIGFLKTSPVDQLKAASFTCNIAGCSNWKVGHTWSLGYEEQFYILFPIAFLFVTPKNRRVFLGCLLANPAIIVCCYLLKQQHFLAEYLTNWQFLIIGIGTALYQQELLVYLSKIKPWLAYLAFPAALILAYLRASPIITVLHVGLLPPLIGIFLFYTSHFVCGVKSLLSTPKLSFAGRMTYGVYLWQQLATGYHAGFGLASYLIALIGVMMLCFLSFVYLEQPLIAVGARLSRERILKERAVLPTAPIFDSVP